MTTTSNLTPNQAWEIYVGDQSPAEFWQQSEATSLAECAREYVLGSPMTSELSADEKDELSDLLQDHLADNLRGLRD